MKGIQIDKDAVLDNIIELSERVCAYDWHENDDDAVKTIDDLRRYIEIIKELLGNK